MQRSVAGEEPVFEHRCEGLEILLSGLNAVRDRARAVTDFEAEIPQCVEDGPSDRIALLYLIEQEQQVDVRLRVELSPSVATQCDDRIPGTECPGVCTACFLK